MAYAHITEDLEQLLYEVDIPKEHYDSVFDTIIGCLDATRNAIGGFVQGPVDGLADLLINVFRPTKSLRDHVIRQFRKGAWETSQRRRLPKIQPPAIG